MVDLDIQMKKNTNGSWDSLFPYSKSKNIYDILRGKTVDKVLTDVLKDVSDKGLELITINNTLGSNANSPEWLKGSVNNSLTYLDNYMRDKFIDVTKEPWNVPKDGTTDATVKLQYALDNVPIRRVIYLPSGTYKITSPIVLKRELTIEGQTAGENGGTLISVDFTGKTAGQTAFQVQSTAKNSNVRNLYLKNVTPEGTAVNGFGNVGDTLALTHFNVADVWVVGFSANFHFEKIYLSRFDRCYAINGYYGFNFLGECTSLIFNACYGNKNTDNYRMQGVLYSSFISCANDGGLRYGYELTNCRGLAFVGCGVETAAETAVKLTSGNRGIHFQALFTHNCGAKNTSIGSMFQIENGNYGVVIDSAYEYTVSDQTTKTLSIVAGKDTTVTVNSATTILPIIKNIPSMVIDGIRKSNIVPNGGTFKQSDFVYNSSFSGTGVYAFMCTVAGTPGTWVQLSV